METVRGIVDHNTIRLVTPLPLPQGAEIEFEPRVVDQAQEGSSSKDAQQLASNPPLGCNSAELYEVLSHRYDTGEHDLAARVDELDP
jgi:hypothetical protein